MSVVLLTVEEEAQGPEDWGKLRLILCIKLEVISAKVVPIL